MPSKNSLFHRISSLLRRKIFPFVLTIFRPMGFAASIAVGDAAGVPVVLSCANALSGPSARAITTTVAGKRVRLRSPGDRTSDVEGPPNVFRGHETCHET